MFLEEKAPGEVVQPHRERVPELDEASKLLLKAADVLEKCGLAKWTTYDEQGRMCVSGAMLRAAGIAPLRDKGSGLNYYWHNAGSLAIEADTRLGKSLNGEPPTWNNQPERTVGEVVVKLRAVALGG